MEVHHHGHVHHQKKWKEYLFQFFMLFLAVFCGFLAEYQLEHTIEHQREKKYVRSLIEDLKSDTININTVSAFNAGKITGMDSLTELIWTTKITKAEAKRMYDLKFAYTGRFRRVLFSRSTLTQLKYSGNLRLIRKMNVADSIIKYDRHAEISDLFADQIEAYVNDNYKAEYEIFSDEYWKSFVSGQGYDNQDFDLLSYDAKLLRMYASRITHQNASMKAYINGDLPLLKEKATRLIDLLTKEYHLE